MNDTCKNCGAWEGLHHYKTNQCPKNGIEAPTGSRQEWQSTIYERDYSGEIVALTKRAEAAEAALQAVMTERDEARRQLAEAQRLFTVAVNVIKAWNGEETWELYLNNAPEMKEIRAALEVEP